MALEQIKHVLGSARRHFGNINHLFSHPHAPEEGWSESGPARRCSRCHRLADPSPDRLRLRHDCVAQNQGHLPAPLHKSCVPQPCFRMLAKFSSKWEKNMNIVRWCVLGIAWLAKIFTLGSWPNPFHMVKSCLPKLSQKKTYLKSVL